MATIGKLAVQITADTVGLKKGLKDAETDLSSFSDKATALVSKLIAIGPAAVLAGGALGATLVRNVANAADELAKLSAKTGVAVEDLSRLQYAADLSGVSNEQLSGALSKLSKSMADASIGGGEAAGAFDAMGISVKNADGTLKSQLAILQEVADKFQGYTDGASKSALAMRIFGEAGTNLVPLLNGGASGIKAMADESDRLGNTLKTSTAIAAEQFNDNLTRLSISLGGVGRQIAGPLIQSLADASNYFIKTANDVGIARAMLLSFGAALEAATGTDRFGTVQREVKLTGNAINLTALQLEKFSKMAESGIPGASQRVEELKNQMIVLLNKSAAASDKLKELANEAYKPIEGSPLPSGAAPTMESPEQKAAREAARKLAEKAAQEAKDRAKEVEDFFGKVDSDARQREVNKMTEFMTALKTREDARIQEGLTEQQRAEEQYAKELEQLTASKEALALTEEEFNERLLQIRMDRDEKIMNADIDLLDNERKIADERVRINQQAEQMITNAREAAANAAIGLLSALGGKSKTAAVAAIALGKALSIAQIIQNTAVAQMRALAELGPLAGSAAAAKIGVMGKLQMGLVAATGLVQAAGVTSGGAQSLALGNTIQQTANSSSPMQANNMAAPGMNQTITVQGIGADSLFSGDAVRTLIDRLIDAQRNGARIVLA